MIKDILIDENGELIFENGDFKIGLSEQQHVVLLISTGIGSWKKYPLVGVGANQYSASSGQSNVLKREITQQLQTDGFVNIDVTLKQNSLDSFDYYITANLI